MFSLCSQKYRWDYLHVITSVYVCAFLSMCGTFSLYTSFFSICAYHTGFSSLSTYLSIFLCLSHSFLFLFFYRPSRSASLFLPSLRNWPVKFSWCDQQHFSKSTVTQPTRLLAHQKAAMAALTRPRVMQRQVSAVSATTTTQTALGITADAIYTCQRGQQLM